MIYKRLVAYVSNILMYDETETEDFRKLDHRQYKSRN